MIIDVDDEEIEKVINSPETSPKVGNQIINLIYSRINYLILRINLIDLTLS